MKKSKNLEKIANSIRKEVIKMAYSGNTGHISSALCIIDILTVLYWDTMHIRNKNPHWSKRDRFILSKGHAASALYATLAYRGYFPKKKLATYVKDNSTLGIHPELDSEPGIEASTGSLGHGLPMATGMALAGKIDKKRYRVFTLISDAELDEGSTWESLLFAPHHKLNNLYVLIDYNKLQAMGETKKILNLEPLKEKLESFGWHVLEEDGHNINKIIKTLGTIHKFKPIAIIFHTIAGKGISFMENKLDWHYLNLTKAQFDKAMEKL